MADIKKPISVSDVALQKRTGDVKKLVSLPYNVSLVSQDSPCPVTIAIRHAWARILAGKVFRVVIPRA